MSDVGFVLLFLLVAAVAAAVGVLSYQVRLRRQREMAAVAHGQGLDFSVTDPFDTLSEPFRLLRKGDGRGVENVLWGSWQGLEVRAFDYWYYEESRDSRGRTSRSYARFDCVLALVDARCPEIEIAGENVLTRIADALTFRDLQFESEEFNRRFDVRCDEPRFATALCDGRMIDWLRRHGDAYGFSVSGDRMLCWRRRIPPEALVALLATAKGFRERIPAVVRSLYPNG